MVLQHQEYLEQPNTSVANLLTGSNSISSIPDETIIIFMPHHAALLQTPCQ